MTVSVQKNVYTLMYKDTKIASTLIYEKLLPFIMRHPNGAISSLTHGSALGFVVLVLTHSCCKKDVSSCGASEKKKWPLY